MADHVHVGGGWYCDCGVVDIQRCLDASRCHAEHLREETRMVRMPAPPRPELDELIHRAHKHVMTPEERFEQMVSFVYGQMVDCAPHVTREEVRQRALKIYGAPSANNAGEKE